MPYPESKPGPFFWAWEVTHEANTLLRLIPTDRPVYGAEVGVYLAKTATILLHRRPLLHLTLVDNWHDLPQTKQDSIDHLTAAGVIDRTRILHGDSTAMAEKVENGSLDYAFIDASKEPAKYRADIEAWYPKVQPGGWMVGHDLSFPDIEDTVRSIFKGRTIQVNRKWNSWWVRV